MRCVAALLLVVLPAAAHRVAQADAPLSLGRFALEGARGAVDGDTLRLADGSKVRILALDAEEVFKDAAERAAAEADFAAYARARRGTAPRPVKYGTPLGELARERMRELLAGHVEVRLERDEPGAPDEDAFGRRLAHVVLAGPEGDELLAERMVREGLSPYFTKYGRSRRHDARLDAAQADARAARRGIWSAEGPGHYPDYEERLLWWESRAAQLARWRAAPDRPDRILLGTPEAERRLADGVGREVVVLGTVERLLERPDTPRKILFLAHRRGRGLPLVVFDPGVWAGLDLDRVMSMYVEARGTLTLYQGRPQIVVSRAAQVEVP